jgi:hypothetical protein
MPQLRFLIRVLPTRIPKVGLLEAMKTISKTFGVDPRNPKWTSYGGLELDIFAATRADFELFLSAVSPIAGVEFVKDLNAAPRHKTEPETFSEARELFNAERYWECHEVLEGVWRTKQGEEKSLLQGLILVCAAFVHHQKGEPDVALSVMARALRQLGYPDRKYADIDLVKLRRGAEKIRTSRRFTNFRI